ncbi:hypothetical protein [Vreelandella titanicae]|uniref:hypothetical protein n=1 Tax=Vreelandella titanicae TaxID=664683 RepID=UPI0039BFFBB1
MHAHQIFEHPYFEERPVKDILEPFGFEVHHNTHELPIEELDTDEDCSLYSTDPSAYIDQLENTAPSGYKEIARFENEDGILIVSVLPKTLFAMYLLGADPLYRGPYTGSYASYTEVYQERMRQISSEGFNSERDGNYMKGELARAAGSYASIAGNAIERGASETSNMLTTDWPFDRAWWKPTTPRRDLVKAGALILAEIERLDRAAAYAKAGEDAA